MPRYITGYIIAELTGAFLCRGVGKGGAGGAAAPPPHFLRRGLSPTFFASDDNFLSTTMPLHTYVYRTNGNCLSPHFFSACYPSALVYNYIYI